MNIFYIFWVWRLRPLGHPDILSSTCFKGVLFFQVLPSAPTLCTWLGSRHKICFLLMLLFFSFFLFFLSNPYPVKVPNLFNRLLWQVNISLSLWPPVSPQPNPWPFLYAWIEPCISLHSVMCFNRHVVRKGLQKVLERCTVSLFHISMEFWINLLHD